MDEARRIVAAEEVPADSTLLFTVRDGFDLVEAILVRLDDEIAAWKNYCQHWTDVRLDKGSGATLRNGEVLCGRHGALFEPDTGRCTYGPCEGAYLDEVEVAVEEDTVFLTDDRYEFEALGPSGDHDLSTGSRIDF